MRNIVEPYLSIEAVYPIRKLGMLQIKERINKKKKLLQNKPSSNIRYFQEHKKKKKGKKEKNTHNIVSSYPSATKGEKRNKNHQNITPKISYLSLFLCF